MAHSDILNILIRESLKIPPEWHFNERYIYWGISCLLRWMTFDNAQDFSALKRYLIQTEPNVLSSCLHPLFIKSSMAQENVLIEQHTNEYGWGGENITLKSMHTLNTISDTWKLHVLFSLFHHCTFILPILFNLFDFFLSL